MTGGYRIASKRRPWQDLAVARFHSTVDESGQRLGAAFGAVSDYLSRAGIEFGGPGGQVLVLPPFTRIVWPVM